MWKSPKKSVWLFVNDVLIAGAPSPLVVPAINMYYL
jgi:hypothetical protein